MSENKKENRKKKEEYRSNDRNLNITINNKEEDREEVVISIGTIIKKLKKYFTVWLVAAIVAFVLTTGYAVLTTHVKKAKLSALISFSYSGIEKGRDPSGRKFDVNTIKNPSVLEAALDGLGMDLTELENIRQGISIKGIIPSDAMDRITVYKSIYETASSGNLAAAQEMLDVTYYPTQYQVYFDYNDTELTSSEAVDVFNTVLNCYQDWFYEEYGYNESLGAAVTAIDYSDYDYSEAVDVFQNSLRTLRSYVRQLSNEDSTRFRSSVTGYTFDDLYQAINTLMSVDLDQISSVITINNVTKDKDESLDYYEYRVSSLQRTITSYNEQIATLDEQIDKYEKDQVVIIGSTETDVDQTITQASAQYDKMISQRISISQDLADAKQSLTYYNERISALKNSKNSSDSDIEKIETKLASLSDKIDELIETVTLTSEDYYKNVTLKNAYNVLVPASYTTTDRLGRIIDEMKTPLVLLEALCILIYFGGAFIEAVKSDTDKRKAAAAGAPSAKYGDTPDDIETVIDTVAEDMAEDKSED
ncbi:MAG: lipopolysaccharide biosynthesis protein [Ruminococcus sp.]|nr:lipopolysaccharide biosynthesis protein [Ruminococcus sp.]